MSIFVSVLPFNFAKWRRFSMTIKKNRTSVVLCVPAANTAASWTLFLPGRAQSHSVKWLEYSLYQTYSTRSERRDHPYYCYLKCSEILNSNKKSLNEQTDDYWDLFNDYYWATIFEKKIRQIFTVYFFTVYNPHSSFFH